jgi:hypothetical protein
LKPEAKAEMMIKNERFVQNTQSSVR